MLKEYIFLVLTLLLVTLNAYEKQKFSKWRSGSAQIGAHHSWRSPHHATDGCSPHQSLTHSHNGKEQIITISVDDGAKGSNVTENRAKV